MVAGTIAFLAFVAVIVVMQASAPPPAPARSIAPPVITTQPKTPSAESPAAAATPAATVERAATATAPAAAGEPPAGAPRAITASAETATPAQRPDPDGADAEPSRVLVALTGSLAGAKRYPLRDPDGVAFNLPRAHASVKVGTYTPDVRGLKAMWVRALPGGGTHLRFFFTATRSAPRIVLERDGVRVAGP
jgi:hypothetical protein